MRLMDILSRSPPAIEVEAGGRTTSLPSAGRFAEAVAAAPTRFVLDDTLTRLCAQTALADAEFVANALDIVRLPLPDFWIEWPEPARCAALGELGIASRSELKRAGLYVRADASGRSGTARPFWSAAEEMADMAPFEIAFDLAPTARTAPRFGVAVADCAHLDRILATADFRFDPEWDGYWRALAGEAMLDQARLAAIGPMFGDLPLLFAFSLLLMADAGYSAKNVDMARLNRARAANKKLPLLDHVELKAAIGKAKTTTDARAADAERRAAPRLHFVRAHLVRRGAAVHFRSAHLRGAGAPIRRTLTLRTAV
jgi:hypothetical protein